MKSEIKLKGKYQFNITFNVPLRGTITLTTPIKTNVITIEGKEYILRRLYSSTMESINYIAIAPTKALDKLKEAGIVKKINTTRLKINGVEFIAPVPSNEIEGIEQIGLTNKERDGVIITHSTLEKPFSKLPEGVTVNINYTLTLGED
jgi:hypothetical protein